MSRQLQTQDIFKFARLCNEIGIKDEIKKACMEANSLEDLTKEELGFEIIFKIVESGTSEKAEAKVYEFFGGLMEKTPEECKTMDPIEFIDGILEVADVEKWKAFFTRVAKLMKSA